MAGSKRSQPDRRGDIRRKSPYPRVARVNAVLLEVIAEALEPIMDEDDRLGLLTVTGVVTEPGLRAATVFLSSLTPAAASALMEHRQCLQAAIGRSVRMKRTPLLEFRQDPAVIHGERVESALRRIERLHE